jgi:hypothetical protein
MRKDKFLNANGYLVSPEMDYVDIEQCTEVLNSTQSYVNYFLNYNPPDETYFYFGLQALTILQDLGIYSAQSNVEPQGEPQIDCTQVNLANTNFIIKGMFIILNDNLNELYDYADPLTEMQIENVYEYYSSYNESNTGVPYQEQVPFLPVNYITNDNYSYEFSDEFQGFDFNLNEIPPGFNGLNVYNIVEDWLRIFNSISNYNINNPGNLNQEVLNVAGDFYVNLLTFFYNTNLIQVTEYEEPIGNTLAEFICNSSFFAEKFDSINYTPSLCVDDEPCPPCPESDCGGVKIMKGLIDLDAQKGKFIYS